MRPYERDLFGEVIITHQDVRLWLQTVPKINPDGPRAVHYVKDYDVTGKITQAKLKGVFEAITAPSLIEADSPAFWQRMTWD